MSKPPKRPDLPDGLLWRGGVIHIVTSVNGRRIRRSTGINNVKAAREQLDALRGAIRIADLTGVQPAALKPRMTLQASGLSLRAFSRKAGLSAPFISEVIHGKRPAPEGRLDHWATLLGLTGMIRVDFMVAGLLSACPESLRAILREHPTVIGELRAKLSRT